jgi:GNAT superfamily N-acetyltransferase
MLLQWHEEAIRADHDRSRFSCGDPALDQFLRQHARQNHERGSTKTYLAIAQDDRRILGFYSLSPAALLFARAPSSITRGLPKHEVPGFRLTRLGVAVSAQGQGLGGQLLLAAGRRCLRVAQEVGGVMLVIDAKSERAATWYMGYGAVPLSDAPLTLVLPLATIADALC